MGALQRRCWLCHPWLAGQGGAGSRGRANGVAIYFFFPAAALAAWYGGLGPGVLAVVLGAAATDWFFIEPVHSWYIAKSGDIVALAAFLISCLFIVGAIESMHRARARALSELAERQRMEATARQTEERHTRLIHSAMDAIIAVSAQQRITLFNPAAERMFGCPAGEAIGGSLDRFIPARHREAHRAHVAKFGQTGVTSRRMGALTPLTGLRANGEEFPIEASISQVEVGGQKAFKVILRDITERKQAEEALRAGAARLMATQLNAPMGVVETSLDHHYLSVNDEFCRLTGYTREELLKRKISDITHSEDWPHNRELHAQMVAGEFSTYRFEKRFIRKDGTRVWVDVSRTLLRNADGKPQYVIGAMIDITERKQAEQALREAHELLADKAKHLESLVQQRTAKLQTAIGDLEAFSYSVAHDVRAPLRAMSAYAAELLKEKGISSQGQTYAERIARAAGRLDRLTQEVLSYSQLARAEINVQPIDLDKLVHQIVEQYPELTAHCEHIEIRSPLLPVVGHEGFLTQALANLLINACKFVEPGAVPKVAVRTDAMGEEVRIWVEDKGIGIAPEHQERVFHMFGRIHPEKKYEGTGIGLAIVKKATERMDGTVGFESEVGKGSRFWVQLKSA